MRRAPHVSYTTYNREGVAPHRQALVNNKFMGYAFAMALGVSPSVENPAHPKYSATGVGHAERVRGPRQCGQTLPTGLTVRGSWLWPYRPQYTRVGEHAAAVRLPSDTRRGAGTLAGALD